MARKNLSIDEQIMQVEEVLKEKESEIKELKKKILQEEKMQQELSEIYQIIVSSGKSFDEIKAILKSHE